MTCDLRVLHNWRAVNKCICAQTVLLHWSLSSIYCYSWDSELFPMNVLSKKVKIFIFLSPARLNELWVWLRTLRVMMEKHSYLSHLNRGVLKGRFETAVHLFVNAVSAACLKAAVLGRDGSNLVFFCSLSMEGKYLVCDHRLVFHCLGNPCVTACINRLILEEKKNIKMSIHTDIKARNCK